MGRGGYEHVTELVRPPGKPSSDGTRTKTPGILEQIISRATYRSCSINRNSPHLAVEPVARERFANRIILQVLYKFAGKMFVQGLDQRVRRELTHIRMIELANHSAE
jgi:hypothetical protein